jgi:multidrug efflux pump
VSRAESSQVTVSFKLNRDPDAAASDVRDRVAQARGALPEEAERADRAEAGRRTRSRSSTWPFSSTRHSLIEIADYANRIVKDRVQNLPGVAQAQVYGNRYAMRVWLDPEQLAGVR